MKKKNLQSSVTIAKHEHYARKSTGITFHTMHLAITGASKVKHKTSIQWKCITFKQ